MSLPQITFDALRAMPDLLERSFLAMPAELRDWEPSSWEAIPGERFSALGQLCHVRDIELEGYRLRIARMLAEENPDLVSIDSYELAKARNYPAEDWRGAIDAFRVARAETLRQIDNLTDAQWARSGTFAEYGHLTLQSLLHYLSSHDQQHLACMNWLLGKAAAHLTSAAS